MKILDRDFSIEKVKASYSKVIWIYDFWSSLTEAKAFEKVIELAEIKDGEKILEVAVGTGKLFKEIVKINSRGKNEGIDISPEMLAKAEKRLKQYENYNLTKDSAYKLSYADSSFDLLINNYMLDLLPEEDFEIILDEFYRVVKPGGRVVISSMSFGEKWYNKLWYYLARFFPGLLTGCRPIRLEKHLEESKFEKVKSIAISQNTFPTEIVKAKK